MCALLDLSGLLSPLTLEAFDPLCFFHPDGRKVGPTGAGDSRLWILLGVDFNLDPFTEVERNLAGATYVASARGGLFWG